jgi:hypothetical protein
VQALALTKARTSWWVMEATQGAHVAELEEKNTKLLAELEQTPLALAEVEATLVVFSTPANYRVIKIAHSSFKAVL